jgi:hypothetical protein
MDRRATWTPEQIAMVRKLAGRRPASVIARRVSAIGPHHTAGAVLTWGERHGVSLLCLRPQRRGGTAWLEGEDAIIKAHAGRRSVEEINAEINARFGRDRSVRATIRQAQYLGCWVTRRDGMTLRVLSATLGVRETRIPREVDAGRLRVERRGTGAGSWWLFRDADVETWINAYPYALDWRLVKRERWRNLARAASLRDRHLSVTEVAGLLAIKRNTLTVWIRKGLIGGIKDIGSPIKPTYRVPLRALDRIEQLAGQKQGAAA